MKKLSLAVAVGSLTFALCAAQQGEMIGGEYVVMVAADAADVTLNGDDVSALGSNVNLVKKGEGRLVSAQDLSAWSGTVRVEAGYFKPTSAKACGGASATLDVRESATCEYACTDNLTCGNVKIAGFGVGGTQGAIRGVLNANQKVTKGGTFALTGDALVVMPTSGKILTFDYGFTSFDMGGHTLTVEGSSSGNSATVEIKSGITVTNPGHICVRGSTGLTLEGLNLGGDEKNSFTLGNGTSIRQASVQNAWSLTVSGAATIKSSGWNNKTQAARQYPNFNEGWKGPVTLNDGAVLTLTAVTDYAQGMTNSLYLSGAITGLGALKVDAGHVKLSNAKNSFAGGLTLSGSTACLHADSLGCMPPLMQEGKFTITQGSAEVTVAQDDFLTDANLAKIWNYNRTAVVSGALRLLFAADYAVAQALTGPIGIGKSGVGTVTLTGGESGENVSLVGNGGDLVVTGADKPHAYAKLSVLEGAVAFTNAGTVAMATNNVNYIGAVYPETAILRIGTNSTLVADYAGDPMPKTGGERLTVGAIADATKSFVRGVLEIGPGGTLTNQVISKSGGATSMGSVFVRGGTLAVQHGQDGADTIGTGYGQQGYFRIDSGLVDYHYSVWADIGGSTGGYGVFEQNGGLYDQSSRSFVTKYLNGNGMSVFRGTAQAKLDGLEIGFTLWGSRTVKGGEGSVTIDGDAVVNVGTWGGVELGGVSNSVSVLNLNGGTLRCSGIYAITNNTIAQRNDTGNSWPAEYGLDTAQRYVYFNGGTVENSGSAFKGIFVWPQMSRVTIGPGGAIFNVSDMRTIPANLLKPSGKGVASVPFACDVPKRYVGAPYVQISGDGHGATALAEFDPDTYTITGVTVTSPGNDYTHATATVQLGGWTQTVDVDLDGCLADNAKDGGVTMKGTGTLVLSGTNTYEGVSRAAGGILAFAETNALPAKSVIEVAGGTVTVKRDGNSKLADVTVAGLRGTGAGGTIQAGTLTTDTVCWNPTNHAPIAVNGNLVLRSDAKIVVEDPENLDDSVRSMAVVTVSGMLTGPATLAVEGVSGQHQWNARIVGKTLRFGPMRGLQIIVR